MSNLDNIEIDTALKEAVQVQNILHLLHTTDITDLKLQKAIHKTTILTNLDLIEKIAALDAVNGLLTKSSQLLIKPGRTSKLSDTDVTILEKLFPKCLTLDHMIDAQMQDLIHMINKSNKLKTTILTIYDKYGAISK